MTDDDAGGDILIHCDNLPSVQALTSGRAHNTVLAECAQAIWMLQAKYAIKISHSHIAGQDNQVADALSRAHTSTAYYNLADDLVKNLRLTIVHPCTHILSNLHPPVLSRSGVELAGGPSGGEAGTSPRNWNEGSITIVSELLAFCHRSQANPMFMTEVQVCIWVEFLASKGIAPATTKNKVSHAQGYMKLAWACLTRFNHVHVIRALDAVHRRKDHILVIKDAIPAQMLRAALQSMSQDHNGLMVRAAILLMAHYAAHLVY